MKVKSTAIFALLPALAVSAIFVIKHNQSQSRVDRALNFSFHASSEQDLSQKVLGTWQHWSTRVHYLDVVSASRNPVALQKILPLTKDKHHAVRNHALQIIGRMNTSQSEYALSSLIKDDPSDARLKWYLARAQTREMKGEKRLHEILKRVGYSLSEIGKISKALSNQHPWNGNSFGYFMIDEIADLVYRMRKDGQLVNEFLKPITFNHGHQILVDCGKLTDRDEIQYILDDLSKPKYHPDFETAIELDHLVGIGKTAVPQVVKHLETARANPDQYNYEKMFVNLFDALIRIDADKAKLVIPKFRTSKWPHARTAASLALYRLGVRDPLGTKTQTPARKTFGRGLSINPHTRG